MEHGPITPQLAADFLLAAVFAIEAMRKQRNWALLHANNRGTTPVFWGCYALTLLALNADIPSPAATGAEIAWIGVGAAVAGLGAHLDATVAAARRVGLDWGRTGRRGKLVLWVGAAAASTNVIVTLSVAVAMLAATGISAAESSGKPALDRR